jgi:hypothetical protein
VSVMPTCRPALDFFLVIRVKAQDHVISLLNLGTLNASLVRIITVRGTVRATPCNPTGHHGA